MSREAFDMPPITPIRAPRRGLLLLEGRALLELAALLPAYPLLRRGARIGVIGGISSASRDIVALEHLLR